MKLWKRPDVAEFLRTKQQGNVTISSIRKDLPTPNFDLQRNLEERVSSFQPHMIEFRDQFAKGDFVRSDHYIGIVNINNTPYVAKELKPTSREMLVFGLGIPPDQVQAYRDKQHGRRVDTSNLSMEEIARKMRLAHNVITAHLGEVIEPTAILVRDGRIFRIQRYHSPIPIGPGDTFELKIRTRAFRVLYEDLRRKWKDMLSSSDFRSLPDDVKAYYRHFGLDEGDGGNAIWRDIMLPPTVIDY